MKVAQRGDFCVGYFNLRGWRLIDGDVERWRGGEGRCCRLLIGMQYLPAEELREIKRFKDDGEIISRGEQRRMQGKIVQEFHRQLIGHAPSNKDEAGLRKLAGQIRAKKLQVKLYLRYPLHAKLYLLFRSDPVAPVTGYLGSSNLTMAGLVSQGELNMDVLEQDAGRKLAQWFEDRWNDDYCLDISADLARAIGESWAREALIPPHHIYLKMAYHLSHEARAGLSEYQIPGDLKKTLLEFQSAAVKIAARHLDKRGGVLIGDVVGLGKTLMAVALARIFEDHPHHLETLILCPRNLVPMWEQYREKYGMRAAVLSLSQAKKLKKMARRRVVIIDESHNLRNRAGKRYRAVREYIEQNDSKCILLSATPYNKAYLDLSNQLRLFVPPDKDLGIKPECLLRSQGDAPTLAQAQINTQTLEAFEKSEEPGDWRNLMRLYLVRRTRGFIKDNYARKDSGGRPYLTFEDGTRSYFPRRIPRTVRFSTAGQYERLFSEGVVESINRLQLPRYGLKKYEREDKETPPTPDEKKILDDLSRAGRRLTGFCRTNFLKRLESGGHTFLLSLERHILRNFVCLYAIKTGRPMPIGATDSGILDNISYDGDMDNASWDADGERDAEWDVGGPVDGLSTEGEFRNRAEQAYKTAYTNHHGRYRWISPHHFDSGLAEDLERDARALIAVAGKSGRWDAAADKKVDALYRLLTNEENKSKKVLVFSQFSDTVHYLADGLRARGLPPEQLAAVTGGSDNPTKSAWRFSPQSNNKQEEVAGKELRVLITTDVLSEGQNLQDCAVVVNYDLPWAIIRLIQRAGRVDRIGQNAEKIMCHSFLPADRIDDLIRLRERVLERLNQNHEVLGADEEFLEGQRAAETTRDLYNEKSGILDDDKDQDVDISSYAWQIWKNATDQNPHLKGEIEALPNVVHSTKAHRAAEGRPEGALVYVRTASDYDALAWVDRDGSSVTENQFDILEAAASAPGTRALPRHETHHELVRKGAAHIARGAKNMGGQLGHSRKARAVVYRRLVEYQHTNQGGIFATRALDQAIKQVYRYPLQQGAEDILTHRLKTDLAGVDAVEKLLQLVFELMDEGRLCKVQEDKAAGQQPQIICSLGLRAG